MSFFESIANTYSTYLFDWSPVGILFTSLQVILLFVVIRLITILGSLIVLQYDKWYSKNYLNHICNGFYVLIDTYIDSHKAIDHQNDTKYRYIYRQLNYSDDLKDYLFTRMSIRAADVMSQIMESYSESKYLTARGYIRHYQDQIIAAMHRIVSIEIDILNIDKLIEAKLLDVPAKYLEKQDKS